MFIENERVQGELTQTKPRNNAIALLKELKPKLTISAHKDEIDDAIKVLEEL
jgi:hypothetical protein